MLRYALMATPLLAACVEGGEGGLLTTTEEGDVQWNLGDPQDWIDPVEYALAATTTAGWMGTLTLAHLEGGHPCVTEGNDALVLTPGPDCPHPLLPDLEGSAMVVLDLAAPNTVSADASGLNVGGRALLAQQFTSLYAAPVGDEIDLLFRLDDYDREQTEWGARIDTAGTSALDDDTLMPFAALTPDVVPSGEDAETQIASMVASFVFSPDCRLNPIGGNLVLEGSRYWPLLDVMGQPDCDGKLRIDSTDGPSEWTPTLDLLR